MYDIFNIQVQTLITKNKTLLEKDKLKHTKDAIYISSAAI